MGRIQLYLLGTVRAERDGTVVQGFESRKALALLCYLALRGQPQTRAHLAELFWEGKSEERGRGNLNRVLHNLAQILPGALVTSRQTVGVATDDQLWIDTSVFEALVARGDPDSLARAAELYRGDLMAELQLDDCSDFEQWLDGAREHWRQQQTGLLQRLIAYHQQRGTPGEGLPWATRLLQLDPWDEFAHRSMMELLYQSGQTQAALAQFETCRRVLKEELGVEPEDETLELYERIRSGPPHHPQGVSALFEQVALAPVRHTSLPTPTTSFVDRQAELALLLERLRDPSCRLVTLTGPGGIGKSRLALEAAIRLAADEGPGNPFTNGVVFVPLAAVDAVGWGGLSDESAAVYTLATSIADALRMVFSGPDAPPVQVRNYLREKELLLVLDNCEQLLAAVGFLGDLLYLGPGLKIMATSQVRLYLQGEHIIELKGLSFPVDTAAAGGEHSALTLFLQRAQAVHPGFSLSRENRTAAARIAQLVDGMPLGLELAASWVRVLPCAEIARELEQSLGFLKTRRRDAPRRHQSLHAVFDYAWGSLSEEEQLALRRLSVFRGGFTREAADAAVGADLPLLASLMDNSLLRRASPEEESEGMRFELLEVVRLYAAEKLAEADRADPLERARVADRHSDYYLGLLQRRLPDLRGAKQRAALAEIAGEIENIRQALRWATQRDHVSSVDRALSGLFHFYNMRSWFAEGESTFKQLAGWLAGLEQGDPDARFAWGRVLARQGWFTYQLGNHAEAQRLLEQSLTILRALDRPAALEFPLHRLAMVLAERGEFDEAMRVWEEADALGRASADNYRIAISKTILCQINALQGHHREAQRYGQESLALDRAIGNRWGEAFSLNYLGTISYALGDYAAARSAIQESMLIRNETGDLRGVAQCLEMLGDVALAQKDHAEAERCYYAALARFREIGNTWGVAAALIRQGYSALDADDKPSARERFGEALRLALRTQATPRALSALLGFAALTAAHDPGLACAICGLVAGHPAASRDSRERAAGVLAQLNGAAPPQPPVSLETLAQRVLSQTAQHA
jgi:predicted ATPase/DNA-binding SARP family transcriptional activator